MKFKKWYSNQKLEIWKTIEDYPNYMVSLLGRVKSLGNDKNRKEKILKPRINKDGYLIVNLYKNGKTKQFTIHRLVAIAFIPNPENKPCIDHIDTNPSNNNVKNLRWVSHKENSNNPLSKKKMSDVRKGRYHSEETKQKMSEIHNKRYANMSEEERKEKHGHQGGNNPRAKKVRCIETGEIFNTLKEASEWCGLKSYISISKQMQGKTKSAGKHPITKEKLHWKYVEEINLDLNIISMSNIIMINI